MISTCARLALVMCTFRTRSSPWLPAEIIVMGQASTLGRYHTADDRVPVVVGDTFHQ
jgi:hypothetical protein